MIDQIFSVFDSAANAFMPPFFAGRIEEAIRAFRHQVANADSPFAKFPEDYTLFHIGSFDKTSALVQPLDTPHPLGLAISFLPDKENLHVS